LPLSVTESRMLIEATEALTMGMSTLTELPALAVLSMVIALPDTSIPESAAFAAALIADATEEGIEPTPVKVTTAFTPIEAGLPHGRSDMPTSTETTGTLTVAKLAEGVDTVQEPVPPTPEVASSQVHPGTRLRTGFRTEQTADDASAWKRRQSTV
jgi:hypothetical protein